MNFALLQKQPWLIEPEAFAVLFEASRIFVTVEALYGFKAGMPDGIKRIVKPCPSILTG